MFDWQLASDDGGLVAGAVVDDLQQVRARHAVDGPHAPVVEHQDVGLGQLLQPFSEGAAAVPDAQFLLQARYALVDRLVSAPASVLRQRARQPRFSGAGGAGHQHAVAGADPVAQGQAHDLAPVDAAPGARVDVFDGGLAIFQVRVLEQSRQLAVIAGVNFAVDQ